MNESESIDLKGASLDEYVLSDGGNRGAVIICPGGAYAFLSPREGEPVARAFNKAGFHAFVLHYSCAPAPLGFLPLRQLGQAVASVRERAESLRVDPDRVAVCGFSAGAHLAASLGVFWDRDALFPSGPDAGARRPNALILSYPVITSGSAAHRASFERLAGSDRGKQEAFSLERFVSERTPPSFMWHTATDETVSIQNSLLFFQALTVHGVASELHVYSDGPHGLSLATAEVEDPEKNRFADPHVATWFDLATQWLPTAAGR
ncbi:MAG: alpha/beta hydrolase [Treponemataceae bacterium]